MFKFIDAMTTGVVTRFGKYSRMAGPGLAIYIPIVNTIQIVSNRIYQNSSLIQVRTADKVFPKLDIALQHKIYPEDSATALYTLSNPQDQMMSYTQNVVRRVASSMTLDQLFESQQEITGAILQQVGPKMKEAGYTIETVQIRNIQPPPEVLASMNQINASERRKLAAVNDGEAAKIKAVKLAQAQALEKELRGQGIAKMRSNITEGWVQSVSQMSEKTGTRPTDVLQFLVKILQQQTLQVMSKNAGTKVIFVDKSIKGQGRQDLLQALEAHTYKAEKEK